MCHTYEGVAKLMLSFKKILGLSWENFETACYPGVGYKNIERFCTRITPGTVIVAKSLEYVYTNFFLFDGIDNPYDISDKDEESIMRNVCLFLRSPMNKKDGIKFSQIYNDAFPPTYISEKEWLALTFSANGVVITNKQYKIWEENGIWKDKDKLEEKLSYIKYKRNGLIKKGDSLLIKVKDGCRSIFKNGKLIIRVSQF